MKKSTKMRARSLAVMMLVMVFLFTGLPLMAYAGEGDESVENIEQTGGVEGEAFGVTLNGGLPPTDPVKAVVTVEVTGQETNSFEATVGDLVTAETMLPYAVVDVEWHVGGEVVVFPYTVQGAVTFVGVPVDDGSDEGTEYSVNFIFYNGEDVITVPVSVKSGATITELPEGVLPVNRDADPDAEAPDVLLHWAIADAEGNAGTKFVFGETLVTEAMTLVPVFGPEEEEPEEPEETTPVGDIKVDDLAHLSPSLSMAGEKFPVGGEFSIGLVASYSASQVEKKLPTVYYLIEAKEIGLETSYLQLRASLNNISENFVVYDSQNSVGISDEAWENEFGDIAKPLDNQLVAVIYTFKGLEAGNTTAEQLVFDAFYPNAITPYNTKTEVGISKMWIAEEKDAEGNITQSRVEWTPGAGKWPPADYKNPMPVATGKSVWVYKVMTKEPGTVGLYTDFETKIARAAASGEGEAPKNTIDLSDENQRSFIVGMDAKDADAETNYIRPKELNMYVDIRFGISEAIEGDSTSKDATGTIVNPALFSDDDSPIVLYKDGALVTAEDDSRAGAFFADFDLDTKMLDTGWTVTAIKGEGKTIRLHYQWTGDSGYPESDFSQKITIKRFHMEEPLGAAAVFADVEVNYTQFDQENTANGGSSVMLSSETNPPTEEQIRTYVRNYPVTEEGGRGYYLVNLLAPPTWQESLDSLFDGMKKTSVDYTYNPKGYKKGVDDEYGLVTNGAYLTRNYVSDGEYQLFDNLGTDDDPVYGKITMRMMWMEWNKLDSVTGTSTVFGPDASFALPEKITKITLTDGEDEAGVKGFKPSELNLIGFKYPELGEGNKYTITMTVSGYTEDVVITKPGDWTNDKWSDLPVAEVRDNDGELVGFALKGNTITSIAVTYEKGDDKPLHIKQAPQALFRLAEKYTSNTDADLHNISTFEVSYKDGKNEDGSDKILTYVKNPAGPIKYQPKEDLGSGTKMVEKVDSNNDSGHIMQGDKIRYTVSFVYGAIYNDENEIIGYENPNTVLPFADGLMIRDIANSNILFPYVSKVGDNYVLDENTGITVEITHGSMKLPEGREGTDLTLYTTGTKSADNPNLYTQVRPEVTAHEWKDDKDVVLGSGLQFLYKFDGTLRIGDKVTITYEAEVAKGDAYKADAYYPVKNHDGDAGIYNEYEYATWIRYDGEGSGHGPGGNAWKWGSGNSSYHPIDKDYLYGDVRVSAHYDGVADLTKTLKIDGGYYRIMENQALYYNVHGGTVGSDLALEKPLYVFGLAPNMVLDAEKLDAGISGYGIVRDLTKRAVTFENGKRKLGEGVSQEYEVLFYDKDGNSITIEQLADGDVDTAKVRYIAVKVDTTLAAMGNGIMGEVIEFNVQNRAVVGDIYDTTAYLTSWKATKEGGAVHIRENKLYRDSSDWKAGRGNLSQVSNEEFQSSSMAAGARAVVASITGIEGLGTSASKWVRDKMDMKLVENPQDISITKSHDTKGADPILTGEDHTYTITVEYNTNAGISPENAPLKPLDLPALLDILPVGETVKEGGVKVAVEHVRDEDGKAWAGEQPVVDFTYNMLTGEEAKNYEVKSEVTASVLKDVFDTGLLVVDFKNLSLYYGSTLTITVETTLESTEHLNKLNTVEAVVKNEASIFIGSNFTSANTAGVEDHSKSAWWSYLENDGNAGALGFGNMEGYVRLTASDTAKHKDRQIAPGIKKVLANANGEPSKKTQLQNLGNGDLVLWKLTVSNNAKYAMDAITGMDIVDVLPMQITLSETKPMATFTAGDLDKTPESYINHSGQQVVYWHLDEAEIDALMKKKNPTHIEGGLQPGESFDIYFYTSLDKDLASTVTNTAYVLPDSGHFVPSVVGITPVSKSDIQSDLKKLYGDDGAAEVEARAGGSDSDSVMFYNKAYSYTVKSVDNAKRWDGQTSSEYYTDSTTPGKLVPVEGGETAHYTFGIYTVQDNQSTALSNIRMVDNLPQLNDEYILGTVNRNTVWNELLTLQDNGTVASAFTVKYLNADGSVKETLKYGADEDYEVYLGSRQANGVADMTNQELEGSMWTSAAKWDQMTEEERGPVRSFSIVLNRDKNIEIQNGTAVVVEWNMTVPELDEEYYKSPAYNSAAAGLTYNNGANPVNAEPPKVGLILVGDPEEEDLSLMFTKTLADVTAEEEQTFRFRLEYYDYNLMDYRAYPITEKGVVIRPGTESGVTILDEPGEELLDGVFTMTVGVPDENGFANNFVIFDGLDAQDSRVFRVVELLVPEKYQPSLGVSERATDAIVLRVGEYEGSEASGMRTNGVLSITNAYTPKEEPKDPPEEVDPSTSIPEEPDTTDPDETDTTDPEEPDEPDETEPPAITTPPTITTPPAAPRVTPPGPGGTPTTSTTVMGPSYYTPLDNPTNPADGPDGLETPVIPTAHGRHWSLLNLMCALFCGITSILMTVMMVFNKLKKKREDEEDETAAVQQAEGYEEDAEDGEDEVTRKNGYLWRILAGFVAVAAIVAFLITEDIRNPMVFACEWTPLMVTFAASQVLVMLGLRQSMRKPDEDEFDEDDLEMEEI